MRQSVKRQLKQGLQPLLDARAGTTVAAPISPRKAATSCLDGDVITAAKGLRRPLPGYDVLHGKATNLCRDRDTTQIPSQMKSIPAKGSRRN